MGLCS